MSLFFTKTSTDWQQTIRSLEQQQKDAQEELASLEDVRQSHQLAAALGDAAAIAALSDTNRKRLNILNRVEDLTGAIAQAQAKLAQAQEQEAQKAKLDKAKNLGLAVKTYLQKAQRVDAAMENIQPLLGEYLTAAQEIVTLLGEDGDYLTVSDLRTAIQKLPGACGYHFGKQMGLADLSFWRVETKPLVELAQVRVKVVQKIADKLRA